MKLCHTHRWGHTVVSISPLCSVYLFGGISLCSRPQWIPFMCWRRPFHGNPILIGPNVLLNTVYIVLCFCPCLVVRLAYRAVLTSCHFKCNLNSKTFTKHTQHMALPLLIPGICHVCVLWRLAGWCTTRCFHFYFSFYVECTTSLSAAMSCALNVKCDLCLYPFISPLHSLRAHLLLRYRSVASTLSWYCWGPQKQQWSCACVFSYLTLIRLR